STQIEYNRYARIAHGPAFRRYFMGLIPSHESLSPRWNLALEQMPAKCLIITQKFPFMWINYRRTPIPRKRLK
ncbi:MAG: hypothetical protein MK003_13745, partial [Pseudomonadales bacterium]|nr:hypothetical protein [Pseudomonadales bacterium]